MINVTLLNALSSIYLVSSLAYCCYLFFRLENTVSLNQVHHDNVPMPIPDGASPPFAWTLQPGGSTFDPPIQIEYPNMSGLAPGSVAYFLSFNHDTERFEIVCGGHVSDDSATIGSDTGLLLRR